MDEFLLYIGKQIWLLWRVYKKREEAGRSERKEGRKEGGGEERRGEEKRKELTQAGHWRLWSKPGGVVHLQDPMTGGKTGFLLAFWVLWSVCGLQSDITISKEGGKPTGGPMLCFQGWGGGCGGLGFFFFFSSREKSRWDIKERLLLSDQRKI